VQRFCPRKRAYQLLIMTKLKAILVVTLLCLTTGASLRASPAPSTTVGPDGVWRWSDSGREVALFGVNYTTPFAYAYRAHKALGVPLEKAIDADVYHLSRLGFDAYRVHIWDREISDPDGNLLENDHLRLFDYLLASLQKRGFKIVLTALQFGNGGYPDVGEPLNGFSARYGKKGCLEDKTSWPLQERYLEQLVRHVNAYTGVAYKDDPAIIGYEVCNEPGHSDYQRTVDYINTMVAAMRRAGVGTPIFYNMSHGLPVAQAYLDANVQGGTFQWYPSNLLAGHEQQGNFLPYIDDYPIPFADNPKFKSKTRMFYEFDSADIGRSYIYPAMARTFRKVGAQFATQFAYDPMYLSPYNTEYVTHYVNLAYAPQKALSLMIAGEAFRRVPLFKDYGPYPKNTNFEGVRVSYESDLAELNTPTAFLYTNDTTTQPVAPDKLERIAGYGRSPVVAYPGMGAYFLDRLDPGVWRLEVMPDAIWVHDPFEKSSLQKQVSRIAWNEWPMRIALPDLGEDFDAVALNEGNRFEGGAHGAVLQVRPGVYLLTRRGVQSKRGPDDEWHHLRLKEFVAPPASVDRRYVLHEPAVEASAGEPIRVAATVVSPEPVRKVTLVAYPPESDLNRSDGEQPVLEAQPGKGNGPGTGRPDLHGAHIVEMRPAAGLQYIGTIPAGSEVGTLRYHVVVETDKGVITFPSEQRSLPTSWDFFGKGWATRIVPAHAPVLLFEAATDAGNITADGRDVRYDLVPSDRPGTSAMEVVAQHLNTGEHDLSFRFFFRDRVKPRAGDLRAAKRLVLFAKSATAAPCPVQVALITSDGAAYGAVAVIDPKFGSVSIPLSALRHVRSPNIPHGYPVFIPQWSEVGQQIPLELARAESVLISVGPGLAPGDYAAPHGLRLERIWLE
jgi:hypothetical protein